jgi:hypothetical protein
VVRDSRESVVRLPEADSIPHRFEIAILGSHKHETRIDRMVTGVTDSRPTVV